MRTVGGLHAGMLVRANLTWAVQRAMRGRRERPEVREYLGRLDEELDGLRERLESGRLDCGRCHTFVIHDPKERRITAPIFRERVLHHAVMNLCAPVLDRRQPFHSYACREGKGTFRALDHARRMAGCTGWFLKLDVRKYFDSIRHDLLEDALMRVFREDRVVSMLLDLVRAYRPGAGRGLAIGTLVSQHLANFFLVRVDEVLVQAKTGHPRGYVRYMDDLAAWFDRSEDACRARDGVVEFAASQLDLEFKTRFINRTSRGMDFLGHRVHPHWLGLNRASRRRYARAIRHLHGSVTAGTMSEREAQMRATSVTAFTARAHCIRWRRRIHENLENRPQAGGACSAVAAGSTTAGTPPPATATATSQATGTTTSGSGPVPALPDGRSPQMEQACSPAPDPRVPDKTQSPRHRSVTDVTDVSSAKADAGGDSRPPLFP